MAQLLSAKVIRVAQAPVVDAAGNVTRNVRVTYMVGEHGPFDLTFAPADFTAPKVQAAMAAQAAVINSIAGS